LRNNETSSDLFIDNNVTLTDINLVLLDLSFEVVGVILKLLLLVE